MPPVLFRCHACRTEFQRFPTAPPYCPNCGDPIRSERPIDENFTGLRSRQSTITVREVPVNQLLNLNQEAKPITGRIVGVSTQAKRAGVRMRLVGEGSESRSRAPEYEVNEVIARGGMGEIVAARQVSLDREVVIKRLPTGVSDDEARTRFYAEAVMTGSLDHPNIVSIHELAVDQHDRPFYAMKRIHGHPWIERWRGLSLSENLDVLVRVCDAIAFAHARGVVHRDLKLENVMMGDFGEVLVVDWGLAVSIEEIHRDRDAPRLAFGTPAYMAPEMASGEYAKIGPATDIYLLGATLFELLVGEPPHPGEDPYECIRKAAYNIIDPAIPEGELGDIVRRAMETNPADRFPDVGAFQTAIKEYREHVQSARLADSAALALERGRQTGSYDEFSRALFGFEEAVLLWSGNVRASDGALAARRAYAERAFQAGDLDLAGSLIANGSHERLKQQITAAHHHRRSTRQRARVFTVASIILLMLLVSALGVGFIIARSERLQIIQATRQRDEAEARLNSLEKRSWSKVIQEDFTGPLDEKTFRTLSGSWTTIDRELKADGPGLSAVKIAGHISGNVRVTYEWVTLGSHSLLLDVRDELTPGFSKEGVEVALGEQCQVRRGHQVLAAAPLSPPIRGLSRHVRIERDGNTVLVLIDGRELVRTVIGSSDPQRPCIALEAEAGVTFDNMYVERLND